MNKWGSVKTTLLIVFFKINKGKYQTYDKK